MYNQFVLFIESDVRWLLFVVVEVKLIALACCNNSANFVLSTDVEPSNACATSGIICIVIIGTVDDDDAVELSVVVVRVNGATANKSWAFVKLIVTRLLLFGSNKVFVGIVLTSFFDKLRLLAVVIGKWLFLKHAWRVNKISNWCFWSDKFCTERWRFCCCSASACSVFSNCSRRSFRFLRHLAAACLFLSRRCLRFVSSSGGSGSSLLFRPLESVGAIRFLGLTKIGPYWIGSTDCECLFFDVDIDLVFFSASRFYCWIWIISCLIIIICRHWYIIIIIF